MSDVRDAERYRNLRTLMISHSKRDWNIICGIAAIGENFGADAFDLNLDKRILDSSSPKAPDPIADANKYRMPIGEGTAMHRHLAGFYGENRAPFFSYYIEGSYYDKSETRYYDRDGEYLESRMGSYG